MDLSIIIVNYNTKDLLKECIDSIAKHTKGKKYEIIVIDNASADGSPEEVGKLARRLKLIKLIKNKKNIGFAAANNQGIKVARGKYFLLLNSDTLLKKNVLAEMLSWMDNHTKVGLATCALLNSDGSTQGTGGYFPTLIRVFSWMILRLVPNIDKIIKPFHPVHHLADRKGAEFFENEKELDWITGAFFLIRREVFEQIGYLDEDYFMYTEDTDYCFRAKKAGWKVYYLPQWGINHYGGASGSTWGHVIPEYEGVKLFYKKHYPSWQYPILRILLKLGALWRILVIGKLKGKEAVKVYAKAFQKA